MEKIASFTVNHNDLLPGLYVSRKDASGECTVTTFDMRMTAPNREPVMDTASIHTIEHLGATYLRNCADPDATCTALIQRALTAGSRDNITVVLAIHDGGEA